MNLENRIEKLEKKTRRKDDLPILLEVCAHEGETEEEALEREKAEYRAKHPEYQGDFENSVDVFLTGEEDDASSR